VFHLYSPIDTVPNEGLCTFRSKAREHMSARFAWRRASELPNLC
jgi:hypothetical protein